MHVDSVKAEGLCDLLADFSFTPLRPDLDESALRIVVGCAASPPCNRETARKVFEQDGLSGYLAADSFDIWADSSRWSFPTGSSPSAEVFLAPDFLMLPEPMQQRFWACGLLRLLRRVGVFGLHAALVQSPSEGSILLTGASGSGKSTLTLGLAQKGWRYVSDDSVLLRLEAGVVEALALRKPLSILRSDVSRLPAILSAAALPLEGSEGKCRLEFRERFPDSFVPTAQPTVLLLCHIIAAAHSRLDPVEPIIAFKELVQQSGLNLVDTQTARTHFSVLRRLLHQCRVYALGAGRDLYDTPSALAGLLADAVCSPYGPSDRRTHQSV